jgi:hypothetical protein
MTSNDGHDDSVLPMASSRPPPPDGEPAPRLARPSIIGLRRSLRPLFNPRWKPWSPWRVIATTLGFAAFAALLVVLTHKVTRRWAVAAPVDPARVVSAAEPIVVPGPEASPAADLHLARAQRSPLAGGFLTLPPAFRAPDGAYDLVVHFHGNSDLVEESFTLSGLNAVVVILNFGTGSAPYEDRFANRVILPDVLGRAQATMEKRGLAGAHLRRLALTAWSAGYGAVLKVLEQPALAAKVDAVLLLDGIHVGRGPGNELLLDRLAPFQRFAQEAVEGKRLFSITHSNVVPIGRYAGTHETTDALLQAVGVARSPGGETPTALPLRSLERVMAKKQQVPLIAESVARRAGLRVRGYRGDHPEHHMAHLVYMAATALPDLVEWWKR